MTVTVVRQTYLDTVCLMAREGVNKMMGQPSSLSIEVVTSKISTLMSSYGPLKDGCNQNMDAQTDTAWTRATLMIEEAEKLSIQLLQSIQIEQLVDYLRSQINEQIRKSDDNTTGGVRRAIERFVGDSEKLVSGKSRHWCRGLPLWSACLELRQGLISIPLPLYESVAV